LPFYDVSGIRIDALQIRGIFMQTVLPIRSLLILLILALINPSLLPAATEQRTALVIGNSAYSSGPLKNPINDASDMAAMLKKLGFTVTLKKDATLREMEEAILAFGNSLKRGGVGLFYYTGHGVQVNGTNYLLPIGARINKEADVKYEAVDANRILDEMASANNGLNIVMLDACRDNPFARSFRNAARGLAIVSSAPSGTFISYSTSPGNVARDGDGRNSPYTQAVLENIAKPGLSINNVFMNVRSKMKRETGQIPWELSSLESNFYFVIQDSRVNIITNDSTYSTKSDLKAEADELARQKAALEREKQEMAREKQELERQKALDAEREQLAAERRKLEAERQQLAMAKRPSQPTTGEIARDGRFIAYSNGTVLDTRTNLMWAAKDNGSDINWSNAKSYCENYRGGGYTDWRMPTQDELAGLYDAAKSYKATQRDYNVKLTELIQLSGCCPWASETRGSEAAFFNFILWLTELDSPVLRQQRPGPPGAFRQIDYLVIWFFDYFLFPGTGRSPIRCKISTPVFC
jgi:uncharacterized caspase-like protein